MTQQKAAWSFPPFRESFDERPALAQDRTLPPLPAGYEPKAEPDRAPVANIAAVKTSEAPAPSAMTPGRALQDTAIVRASDVQFTPPDKNFASPGPGAVSDSSAKSAQALAGDPVEAAPKPIFAVAANHTAGASNASMPGIGEAMTKPIEPPPPEPVPLDPKTTSQIVKQIVGASDDIIRTSAEPDPEADDEIVPALPGHGAFVKPSKPLTGVNLATDSRTLRPPLETIPADTAAKETSESKVIPESPRLTIPRAAICKSVEGRGRFAALPEHARTPGSPIIVYWEMDDLARSKTIPGVEFTALVELVSTERDEILASSRETVRESGPEPAEGDFAALRWTIPAELAPGDYRIRISVTERTTKQTATTQIDLSLGRSPVASRLVLP